VRFATTLGSLLLAATVPAHALEPEVNLAGTFAIGLSHFSSDLNGDDLDLENNASNFRLTAALQEVSWRAFIAYERGANNDGATEAVREFFGGVRTAYGTFLYGRKATDYRLAGERLDPFYDTSVTGFNGQFASEGPSFGLSALTDGFTSNTIALRTAEYAGVTANAAVYINDLPEPNDKHDVALGVGYSRSDWGLDLGVQYLSLNAPAVFPGSGVANTPGPGQAIRSHGSLMVGHWAIGLSYEIVDVDAETDARNYFFAAASYQLFDSLRLAAAYGRTSDTPFDGNGGTVGAFYDLNRHFGTYVAARYVNLDSGDTTTTFAVGVKFVFDKDL
jgi:predicted porin